MSEESKPPPGERPAPDWWDRLYDDEPPSKAPTAGAEQRADDEDDSDDEARPWWSVRREEPTEPADQEPQPVPERTDVHITVDHAPVGPRVDARRARIRWLLYHGTAAGTGWFLGAGPAMAAFLASMGRTAPAAGVGLCLICAMPALWLPGLPYIPPQLQPATVWLARIPVSTAALALALHAPGTVV